MLFKSGMFLGCWSLFFYFLTVNGIKSTEMLCRLRSVKVKLLNESIYLHPNNSYRKVSMCITLTIEIFFTKKKSLICICF